MPAQTKNAVFMKRLVEFTLPIQGLKNGVHEYDFHIERTFFAEFEASPVSEGEVDVHMTLDRHSDMLVFDFELSGTVRTECDRCLAEIDLPIESETQLVVKFSEEKEDLDDELVFIHPETSELNVAEYIYEYIVLAMPIIRSVEGCEEEENPPCDFGMLARISTAENQPRENPFLDALGGFKEN